jgi:hypothetical protein
MAKKRDVQVCLVDTGRGPALVVDNQYVPGFTRGKTLVTFSVDADELLSRLRPPRKKQLTKVQLERKIARMAGELVLADGLKERAFGFCCIDSGEQSVRNLIGEVRLFISRDAKRAKRYTRIITKLEAALVSWEAAE